MAGGHRDGSPAGLAASAQSDYHSLLAHITTGGVATIVSLVLASVFHLGAAGPAGAPGTTSIITKTGEAGICAYFGPDSKGVTRLQLSVPDEDAAGLYCTKGDFVSVNPVKK